MENIDLESYKFKAESLKQFGFVLCTPLSFLVLKMITREILFFDFLFSYEILFALTFFICGFKMIDRSVDILEKGKKFNG